MKNKKDRKAWLRIIEAFIACLIVIGGVLIILSNQNKTDLTDSVYGRQRAILEILSKNESLRNSILARDNSEINPAILKMIPSSWNFSTSLCDIEKACGNQFTLINKEVYSTEIIIISNLSYYNATKLRFFVWGR